jgi:hypothetical protein
MMRTDDVARDLMPEEKVVWSGTPGKGIKFQSTDLVFVPFSLLWAGFAIFWEATVIRGGAPVFFALWGIPFVLGGAYITVGRFFFDSYLRSRSRYFLTNRRALIVTTWPTRRLRSVNLASLQEIGITESRDGAGTLIFGSQTFATRGTPRSPRFEWIDNVHQVYRVAIAVQSGTDQGAAQQGAAADGLVGRSAPSGARS